MNEGEILWAGPEKDSDYSDLVKSINKYFAENIHNGYVAPFELERIERSEINGALICAVPKGIREEIDNSNDDEKWRQGLATVGEEYGIILKLPYYCYTK